MNINDEIDRAWECLDEGDIEGAREAHARAAKQSPDDPEVIALGAMLAATAGDPDAALAELGRAIELDPDNARYLILMAELELHMEDDPESALESCDRALDVATDDDELIDAVLLKTEALVILGDRDSEAVETLAELEGCAIDDPALWCRTGDLYLALGRTDEAERAYKEAIAEEDEWSDAHHGLGMVYEQRGQKDKMVTAWLRTLEIDQALPLPPWHLSPDEFQEAVEEALSELPEQVLSRLENVPILVEEAPTEELVREGLDPRLLGLFSGQPLPEKSTLDAQPHLDTVRLFQSNLERASSSREHLIHEIRITVLHETAHFFGLDDDALHGMGLG